MNSILASMRWIDQCLNYGYPITHIYTSYNLFDDLVCISWITKWLIIYCTMVKCTSIYHTFILFYKHNCNIQTTAISTMLAETTEAITTMLAETTDAVTSDVTSAITSSASSSPTYDNVTGTTIEMTTHLFDTFSVFIHPHWYNFPVVEDGWHYLIGIYITFVGFTGILGNALVIWIFSR